MDALTRAVRESTDFPSISAPRAVKGASVPARRGSSTRPGTDAVRQRGELQLQVARLLRVALMTGQFVPGQTLSLRQLAAKLGTIAKR